MKYNLGFEKEFPISISTFNFLTASACHKLQITFHDCHKHTLSAEMCSMA